MQEGFQRGAFSCGARLFVVADFVSLAVAFKKATGSLTPSPALLRYCRASRYRVESLCIAAPTPAPFIRHRRRSQALPLSAKSHAALRLFAYKCARCGSACYQLFADTWLCAGAHCGSPTAAPTPARCFRHWRRSQALPFIRHRRRSKMLPLVGKEGFPKGNPSKGFPLRHLLRYPKPAGATVAAAGFDRCANTSSLHRPLGALRLAAARMHRLHYIRQAALRPSCRKCRFIGCVALLPF